MQVKKLAGQSVSGIVMLIAMVVYSIMTGNEQLIGKLMETALEETVSVSDEGSRDGEIRTIKIAKDGDTIISSDKLQLEGGLDFTGKKGDAVIVQKIDGVWVQIGKRLVDMEDFQ